MSCLFFYQVSPYSRYYRDYKMNVNICYAWACRLEGTSYLIIGCMPTGMHIIPDRRMGSDNLTFSCVSVQSNVSFYYIIILNIYENNKQRNVIIFSIV